MDSKSSSDFVSAPRHCLCDAESEIEQSILDTGTIVEQILNSFDCQKACETTNNCKYWIFNPKNLLCKHYTNDL